MTDKNSDDRLPMRVMNLERDLAALDSRCRECSERTRIMLRALSTEISRFGARVAEDLTKINKRIDEFVCRPIIKIQKHKRYKV